MKRQEFVQIKGLDIKELTTKVKELKKDMADLLLDKNMKKIKDLKSISKKRKDLAQILTVVRQKELLGELESNVQKDSERLRRLEDQRIRQSDMLALRHSDTQSNSELSEKSKIRVKGVKK